MLEPVPAGARAHRGEHGVVVEHRQHQYRDLRLVGGDPSGGLDAARSRHPQIHRHDVGLRDRGPVHRLLAGGGLGDDGDVTVAVEHRRHPFAVEDVVVGDEDPDHGSGRSTSDRSGSVARIAVPRGWMLATCKVPPISSARSRMCAGPTGGAQLVEHGRAEPVDQLTDLFDRPQRLGAGVVEQGAGAVRVGLDQAVGGVTRW